MATKKGAKSRNLGRLRGKRNELASAKFWGMKRAHFERQDLHGHPIISVECKEREKGNREVKDWMTQARLAAPKGKVPIVHYHIHGEERSEDICFILATDLRDIIGKGEYTDDATA